MNKYKLDVSKIQENKNNPRIINKSKYEKLLESCRTFPEMLSARPIVIDENNVVLGGNMRFKAYKELGYTEVYVVQIKDWSEKQKKEFIIKDNSNFGDWDWDILGNEWDRQDLVDWGLVAEFDEVFDEDEFFDNEQLDNDVTIELKMTKQKHIEIKKELDKLTNDKNIKCKIMS